MVEPGKMADLVLWKPGYFGVKPELVIKGGFIALANMGDPNASIPTPQPMIYRPQFGAFGRAKVATSVTFVSQLSIDRGLWQRLKTDKWLVGVHNTRTITKSHMVHNDATPRIEVDPETYTVKADGKKLTCEPATVLPMAQRYFLF